jgi:hypothetical protein
MPRDFQGANSTVPNRALQAYLILIGRAVNHQTIQYGELRARPGIAESDLTGDSRACVVCVA